jgi:hypothetical protein
MMTGNLLGRATICAVEKYLKLSGNGSIDQLQEAFYLWEIALAAAKQGYKTRFEVSNKRFEKLQDSPIIREVNFKISGPGAIDALVFNDHYVHAIEAKRLSESKLEDFDKEVERLASITGKNRKVGPHFVVNLFRKPTDFVDRRGHDCWFEKYERHLREKPKMEICFKERSLFGSPDFGVIVGQLSISS